MKINQRMMSVIDETKICNNIASSNKHKIFSYFLKKKKRVVLNHFI